MIFIRRLYELIFGASRNSYLGNGNINAQMNQYYKFLGEICEQRNHDFIREENRKKKIKGLIIDAHKKVFANVNRKMPIDFSKADMAFGHELDLLRLEYTKREIIDICYELNFDAFDGKGYRHVTP